MAAERGLGAYSVRVAEMTGDTHVAAADEDGQITITAEGAAPVTLRPGDAFVVEPGFKGTWEVIETTTKDYVIRL